MILENSLSLGKKWAMISRNLPGRNENSVKNRFLALTKGIKIKGGKKKKADNFLKDSNVQEAIKQMILTLKKQIDQSLLYQSMEKLELNSPIFKLHHLLKSEQPTPMNFDTPLNVFQKGSLGASNTSGELLQNFSYAYKTSQNNRENYSNEDKTNNIPQNVLSFLEGNVTEEIIKNQEFQNNYKGNNTIDEKNSKNYKNQDLNTMKSASRNYNNQSNEVKDNFHNSKSWTANSQNSYNVNHATTNEKNSYQNFNNLWIQNPQNSFFTNQLNDEKIQVFNNFWREYEKKQNLMMSNYNNYMMFLSFMNSQAQTIPTYPNMENFQDTKKELNGNDANLSYLLSSPNENLRNTSLLVGGVNNSFNNNINEENRHMINERRNSASLESGYTSIHFPESRRSSAMNFSGVLSKSSSNNINSHSGISLEILNEEMNEKNLNKMEIENSTNIYPVNQQAPCQKNKKLMAYVVDEINESQKSQDKSKDISQSQIKDLSFPKPISIIDRKPTSLANFSPILFSKSSFNSLTLNFLGQDLFLSSPFLEKGHLNLGQFEGFDFGGMGIDLINNE